MAPARHGMAWQGMLWHGMVWSGVVWHGMASSGMEESVRCSSSRDPRDMGRRSWLAVTADVRSPARASHHSTSSIIAHPAPHFHADGAAEAGSQSTAEQRANAEARASSTRRQIPPTLAQTLSSSHGRSCRPCQDDPWRPRLAYRRAGRALPELPPLSLTPHGPKRSVGCPRPSEVISRSFVRSALPP